MLPLPIIPCLPGTTPHAVALGGLTLVTIIGKHTFHTCVVFGNLVAMGQRVIIKKRRESIAYTAVIALLLDQSSDLLQCLSTFL
jgi:hypothetical protein